MGATSVQKPALFSALCSAPTHKQNDLACVGGWVLVELLERMRGRGFRQRPSTYKISAAPTGRARCRRCRRRIEKGATRVEIRAFVRPGRRTLLLRCADCVDARFAAAVLAVHGRAERVPVEAALAGSAEAQRVQRAIDAASEGGGGWHEEKRVCVCWAFC